MHDVRDVNLNEFHKTSKGAAFICMLPKKSAFTMLINCIMIYKEFIVAVQRSEIAPEIVLFFNCPPCMAK